MQFVVEFGILGLAAGGAYGLLALSIIVIFRTSGVVNFAEGAFAVAAAFVSQARNRWRPRGTWYRSGCRWGSASWVCGRGGNYAPHPICERAHEDNRDAGRTNHYSGDVPVDLRFTSRGVTSVPAGGFSCHRSGDGVLGEHRHTHCVSGIDRGVVAGYRYSRFGNASSAVSESDVAAQAIGISSSLIRLLNWGLAGALVLSPAF